MSTLKALITHTSESGLAVSRKLLQYSQGDRSKSFAKRAIKYLVKKLKDKLDELEALLIAVTTCGTNSSKCVTLQRSSDGRLQISGCTNFPHLIYARIWRWPDLRNHWRELQHVIYCRFAFELNREFVCVNPYHYERETILPTINLFKPMITSRIDRMKDNINYKNLGQDEPSKARKESFQSSSPHLLTYDLKSSTAVKDTIYTKCGKQNHQQFSNNYWCNISYFEYKTQLAPTFEVSAKCSKFQITGYVETFGNYDLCLGKITNPTRIIKSERVRMNIGRGIQIEITDKGTVWLRLLSKHQIFVRSLYMNFLTNRSYDDNTVYKIYPSSVVKVFDFRYYIHVKQSHKNDEKILHYLNKLCTLNISFAKGWGLTYSRESVEETPCWLKIIFLEYIESSN